MDQNALSLLEWLFKIGPMGVTVACAWAAYVKVIQPLGQQGIDMLSKVHATEAEQAKVADNLARASETLERTQANAERTVEMSEKILNRALAAMDREDK